MVSSWTKIQPHYSPKRGEPSCSKRNSGFTLVELMVTVLIVSVLATVAISNYRGFIVKTRVSEAKALASNLYTAQASFLSLHGVYCTHFPTVGFGPEGKMQVNMGFVSASCNAPADVINMTWGASGLIHMRTTPGFCSLTGKCEVIGAFGYLMGAPGYTVAASIYNWCSWTVISPSRFKICLAVPETNSNSDKIRIYSLDERKNWIMENYLTL